MVGTQCIYIARHGETDWNLQHRLQGWTDIALNETGRRQAQDLAERLTGVHLDHIYTSELGRSRETAAALLGHAQVTALVELNERNMGQYEGVNEPAR